MISQHINYQVLCKLMQDHFCEHYSTLYSSDPDEIEQSVMYRWNVWCEPIRPFVDEIIQIVDAETLPEVQKNINQMLTASKHLLKWHKQDIIWFQHSLSRMKSVRGAFKNQHRGTARPQLD